MNCNTPEQQIELNKALIKVISETKDIGADSNNPFHGNNYASLSKHLEVLKPIFAKNGLAVFQMPIGNEASVGIRTTILHKDGGSVSSDALIPAKEGISGQNAGSIYSYLRRYALASVAGCATEDNDAEVNRVETKKFIANTSSSTVVSTPRETVSESTNGDVNFELAVPFGKNKGTALKDLPLSDLEYWATKWEPKPWEKTGKVGQKDLMLKRSAKALYESKSSETGDDVPY